MTSETDDLYSSSTAVSAGAEPAMADPQAEWTGWQRVLFRFAFSFWSLFCMSPAVSFALWFWPWLQGKVDDGLSWPLLAASGWLVRHVLHIDGEASRPHPTGSGDTLLNWVSTLLMLLIAVLACAVWSVWSERRTHRREYRTLYAWLRLVMRFVLAGVLFAYGFDKVFPLQFPFPGVDSLNTTYGASSPMGLLWRFMGFSAVYQAFGGMAEVLPGLLLLFRRTATLGALLAAAVMSNVVALNFTFDVPVKLYSTELLCMALFLLLPDARPIWHFFMQQRSSQLTGLRVPRTERKALRITARCLRAFLLAGLFYSSAVVSWRPWHRQWTVLRGEWAVDAATGVPDAPRWAVFSSNSSYRIVAGPAGKPVKYPVEIVPAERLLKVLPGQGAESDKPQAELHWSLDQGGRMVLTGTWSGAPASVSMHRVYPPKSALETRGFHWVQEYPYNR